MADKEQYPDKIILALRKKQQINQLENTSMEELLEKKEMVLGNFHCRFIHYDRWKTIVLKLLETIELTEGAVINAAGMEEE